uniref:LIMR family protein n=1 Tax=Mantoniella antarctica TaxID=81844 RepID=A0A7S0S7E8_9CHLO|mmetsp:Transcript_11876/g.28848  ORF Transcript_11876/g.28848 Transcript_11876/m.28848 type:complete len:520 (+) Transcript_11876:288-1847(+)
MPTDGYNWFLILVAVVCTVVVVLINVYILVHFQHPEDRNQAWFPKFIVVFGLTLSVLSILLLPLDVANRASCRDSIVVSACNFALPMLELWYTVYMLMFLMIIIVVPWTLFFYEQDSDVSTFGKVINSAMWVFGAFVVIALVIGMCYGFVGFVDFPVTTLTSGLSPLNSPVMTGGVNRCILPESGEAIGYACDATSGGVPTETWSVRTTFPVYVVAVTSIFSWLLFFVFAGVGMMAIPIDAIKSFICRPRKVLAKSEYIKVATQIAEFTKGVVAEAREVQKEERGTGKTRKTRKALAKINAKLAALEEDELTLQKMYPQGEDRDVSWTVTVMGYYLHLCTGVICAVLTLMWMLHIALYMFPDPPVTSFLNAFFTEMDSAFGLFGTSSFALFCFYLIMCVIKGNTKLGLRLLLFAVYPMKLGGTLMSSFLFNVNLIMLSSIAVIQFCAQAFDGYAAETAVSEIFGGEIENLRGLGLLFKYQIFLYAFFVMALLSLIVLILTEAQNARKPRRAFESEISST